MAAKRKPLTKDAPIMVRLDRKQKALVEAIAAESFVSVSAWARERLMRMVHGWKLVPPGSRIISPDVE